MDYRNHIARDPGICAGEPVVKGTRVPIKSILASLVEGASDAEIVAAFPSITEDDVRAVVAFSAGS